MMQILRNLSCTRTQHWAWGLPGPHLLMTLHPILVKRRRRQHYAIVSDSSFDYFKPTGDDFARELMSEIWSTSSKLLAFSRWHTVVVLMMYSRSFCHCFCHCIGVWNQSQRVCTRGDRLPHIGYKRNPPKCVSRECILYLFLSVSLTIYLLNPVTILHGSNPSECRNIWS